ncbi:MAG TPA: hypothetical protein P5121_25585 [Caldilineaceae bacterium]|nr:hypothetical protein [Caldilineaceae bacterium]
MTQPIERFLTALPRGNNQIYLSWRLLGTDAIDEPFVVQRRLAGLPWQSIRPETPIVTSTDLMDTVPVPAVYEYRVLTPSGPSLPVSVDSFAPPTNLAFEFPLTYTPPPNVYPYRFAIGDLENNGRSGVVVLESHEKRVQVCAYTLEGKLLWQRDTGLPDSGGWDKRMNHVPVAVWDINGDGRSEVLYHSGPGLPFPNDFYSEAGPDEMLTAVDGATGEIVWETPWPGTRPRVVFTVGYLRGMDQLPSIVVQDGCYRDLLLTAIDGATGQIQWQVEQARGGSHNLDIDDVDGDGMMEVIAGGICYRGDGSVLWEAEPFGHTDVSKPAKFLPDVAGLQVLYLVEKENPGVYLVNAQGQTLWKVPFGHAHWSWIGRYALDESGKPDERLMIHAAEKGELEYFPVFYPNGREWIELTRHQAHRYAAIGWEADGTTCFAHRKDFCIYRLDAQGNEIRLPGSELPTGSLFGRWQIAADIIGDFRENFGCIDYDKGTFFVAQNPNPAGRRAYSPQEDFGYRHERAQLGSGYYTYIAPPWIEW